MKSSRDLRSTADAARLMEPPASNYKALPAGKGWAHSHLPIMPHHKPATVESMRAFDAWDTAQRLRSGFWAGLTILPKPRGRHIHLAWRHWPHLLCWQWILALDLLPYRPRFFKFSHASNAVTGYRHWALRLLWLFNLTYHRQCSDRIAAFGEPRRSAPAIYYGPREAA